MLKPIPKSDIIVRPITVYKEWSLDENDVFPIFALVSLFPVFMLWVLNEQIHWRGFSSLIQAIIEALLWPLANYLLLLPQRRPIDVDPNRPL